MTTDTIDPIKELDKALEVLKKRQNKLKSKPKNKKPEEHAEPDKKKESQHKKKTYKSYMKVASIVVLIVAVYTVACFVSIPSFRDVVIAIIESINIFSFDDSTGLEHYANIK